MITSKIGNRIRELRKKEGISQEKLAFKTDLDRTYIAGVESGKRNVSVKTLKKILDPLGITLIIFIIVFPLFNILKKNAQYKYSEDWYKKHEIQSCQARFYKQWSLNLNS